MRRAYSACMQIEFKGKPNLQKLERDIKDVKSGRRKPQFLPADSPMIRAIMKQEYDRKRSIRLFNQVYDFLLTARVRYLKQEDYDEHHKKFGTHL